MLGSQSNTFCLLMGQKSHFLKAFGRCSLGLSDWMSSPASWGTQSFAALWQRDLFQHRRAAVSSTHSSWVQRCPHKGCIFSVEFGGRQRNKMLFSLQSLITSMEMWLVSLRGYRQSKAFCRAGGRQCNISNHPRGELVYTALSGPPLHQDS